MQRFRFALLVTFFSMLSTLTHAQILPGGITNEDIIKKKKFVSGNPRMISGLGLKYVQREGDYSLEGGLDFKMRFLKKYYLAATLYTQLNSSTDIQRAQQNIRTYYAGLGAFYMQKLYKKVSIIAGFTASLASMDTDPSTLATAYRTSAWNWHFLIEPSLELSIPVYKNSSVGIGFGYRQALGVDFYDMRNSDLSGIILKLSILNYSF